MRGWRLGEPVWVGRGEGLEVRAIGRVTRARALTVRSPVSKVPLRTVAAAGLPQHRAAERLAGGRVDRSGQAAVRRHAADGLRPPHGGHQRLHAAPGACDRAGDRALPREGERLERHRLQRARRPLRHRLRGTGGRGRPERRRRPRQGVQHRVVRHRRDGRLPHGRPAGCRRRRAREDARLAARPRPRRPARDVQRDLVGQRALRPRDPGLPARDLRPSRHRADDLSGPEALRPDPGDRQAGRGAGAAEDLHARGRGRRVGRHALHREAVVGAPLGGADHRPGRHGARTRRGHRHDGRLDMASRRPGPGGHPMGDLVSRRDRGDGRRCRGPLRPRSLSPARGPTPRRSRRTATARRTRRPSRTRSARTRTWP